MDNQSSTSKSDSIDTTLDQRGTVHGDWGVNALTVTELRKFISLLRASSSKGYWPPEIEAGLDAILVKLARIIVGDPYYSDHWHDIAGYATLVERYCKERK